MDKCRICLGNKKSLRSIFDRIKDTCYADMMQAIAKVKIPKDTQFANSLCRACRQKLEEAYEFKLKIERADVAINDLNKCKRLQFDNFKDIKIEIEIDANCQQSIKKEDITGQFMEGINEITYRNTLIKKAPYVRDDICLKPVPVLDFLKTIKDEDGDDFISDDVDFDEDNDAAYSYDAHSMDGGHESDGSVFSPTNVPKQKSNKRQGKVKKKLKKGKENKSNQQKKNEVCIKPVHLKGYKIIVEYTKRNKPKEQKLKKKGSEVCPYCGIFTRNLKKHILVHIGERKFKCDVCGKGFFTKNSLKYHIKQTHEAAKDFKCDQCIAAFRTKTALQSHKILHSAELKYACEVCGKAFKRRAACRRHVLNHNLANKSVQCSLCNMSFFTAGSLQHHMRIHTGERPFNCEKKTRDRHFLAHNIANKSIRCSLCNMSFFTPANLGHHMRIHTGERPFNCELCSQPYSYKHDFNRHCLNKHGIFLKRRKVRVMNAEVLKREKQILRDLVLRLHGVCKDDQPLNPFEDEGPGAAMAFQMVIKAIENKMIPMDFL